MKLETVEALRLMRDKHCTAYSAAKTKNLSVCGFYNTLRNLGMPTKRSEWTDSDIAKLGELSHVDKLRGES